MKIVKVALDKIEQNENSRVIYKTTELAELMSSMKKQGLLQPVGVRPLARGKFDAVFGNRRILAAKKLGWDEIDAHILEIEDENDRDILNLLENIKRQNTTVAEDGRMFQVLVDRGLTVQEIAARLEVSALRVQTALDVLHEIPQEFHKRIVNTGVSKQRLKDRIPATTAMAVLNVRRVSNLNRAQTRALMTYVADNKPSLEQIHKIGPLVKSGYKIGDAIEAVSDMERISLNIFMPAKSVKALEAKHKKRIHDLLYEALEGLSGYHIERAQRSPDNLRLRRFSADSRRNAG